MMLPGNSEKRTFYVIGLSYKTAAAEVRGRFRLDEESRSRALAQAAKEGIESPLILSTCNRTELYGFAQHPFQLIKILCAYTTGTVGDFEKVGYICKNREAITHLFRVGTGLDSQILGDFEIIGQVKQSFVASRDAGVADSFSERLVNAVLQASKRIKTETEISSGATSVAFAAVQYILKHTEAASQKQITLLGTGKIGRNTCENLVKHTRNRHITLINRTREKAENIAGKFHVQVKAYTDLPSELEKTDILIVATGAPQPTVLKEYIRTERPLLILDLSIPENVAPDVGVLSNVTLVHLDQLSRLTDETLERRKAQLPGAEAIIEELETGFMKWLDTRTFAPTLHALKKKLTALKDAEIDFQRKKITDFNDHQADLIGSRLIQKITTHIANHLKDPGHGSVESIALIHRLFQLENEPECAASSE